MWCLLRNSLLGVVTDHGLPVTAVAVARCGDTQLVLSGSWRQELRVNTVDGSSCPSIRLPRWSEVPVILFETDYGYMDYFIKLLATLFTFTTCFIVLGYTMQCGQFDNFIM